MRILIAEDQEDMQYLFQRFLKDVGDCVLCSNGAEAVKAFSDALEAGDPFQVVLMDIMMPEMDGHEAVRRIRALEKEKGLGPDQETKVIMLTALTDPYNMAEAYLEGGATSYLTKPVKKQELINEINSNLPSFEDLISQVNKG